MVASPTKEKKKRDLKAQPLKNVLTDQRPPPPQYQPYESYGEPYNAPLWARAPAFASQQYLADQYPPSYGLPPGYATPWASTSTINFDRPQTAGAWTSQSAATPRVSRPMTSGNNDCSVARRMNQGAALVDRVAARVNDMLSRGVQEDVDIDEVEALARGLDTIDEVDPVLTPIPSKPGRQRPEVKTTDSRSGILNFKKSWLYRNSRLPPGMVPFKMYTDTWPVVCRAANASLEVYKRPRKGAAEGYVAADPRSGTKAMLVKDHEVDDRKLLIVAIRGSQKNIVDWQVNFGFDPKLPVGFLDDEGNACHAGFLEVARAMIGPVAAQLRSFIENEPSWAGCSLLFTGHSAGGAVASLLYMHIMSKTLDSELTSLAGVFRRLHCVTFGAPPVSLLSLQLPSRRQGRSNQFLAFANEGDLVVRADWAYIKSLSKLLASPAPNTCSHKALREHVSRQTLKGDAAISSKIALPPRWPVPDASLSTAGRLVLLREKPTSRSGAVEAVQLTDEELRSVVFGDPAMHTMTLYKQRIDALMVAAISGEAPG
ncbi:hypothetical protein LTR78_010180 [Recurvomyces mirabilis]|uniref:Fungal lipase-type domain-containing protein n=1 Tax=Recurvomyces mirabilis TaxID=574656 RepID=A0AAE0TMP8_9PEZI|nr:hypothetical protein LTR78_010180 [Recurvomyces mirabilis]KAK5149709.1 hypothetical protein LTS14_010707 [Recurvomyces mirabilis]